MIRGAEVLRGVLVFGRIAAADVPAGEALSEVDPGIYHLEALLAPFGARLHVPDLV